MSSDALRAEFLAWVRDRGCDTDGAWSAYQACAAARADEVQRLREALARVANVNHGEPIDASFSGTNAAIASNAIQIARAALAQPTPKESA